MPSDAGIIWTIGHSTRSIDDFTDILRSFQIELVADVRKFPGSRRFPHFNKESLTASLNRANIRYVHLIELGGRRTPRPDSQNTGWRHHAFRGYADYMDTEAFQQGIRELEENAIRYRTAYMCSEALWWKCHRALISDFLKAAGWQVIHILDAGKSSDHKFSKPATILDGKLNYGGLF